MNKMDRKKVFKELIKNKKKLIIQVSSVLVVVIVGVVILNFTFSHGNETEQSFLQDQRINGLLFTRASFDNNKLVVYIKNETNSDYDLNSVTVSFYDEDNNLLTTILGYVGNKIESNEVKQLSVETDLDISDTNKIVYKINN